MGHPEGECEPPMLLDVIEQYPERMALDDGSRRVSFAQLGARAATWCQWFGSQGLARGQHIGILSRNRLEYVEVILGAFYAGLWVVPINRHLTAAEIRYQIADAGLAFLVAERKYSHLVPSSLPVTWLDDENPADAAAAPVAASPDFDQPAGGMMLYTSGTSGAPRGVKRAAAATVRLQLQANAAAGRQLGLNGCGAHLLVGPMYHAAPLLFALYDLFNGASVYLMQRFDAEAMLQAIERWQIAHTHVVPTMLVRLAKLPRPKRQRWDLSSLRQVLHGAAPISAAVKRDMINWWGPLLSEYWGATESGVCTVCSAGQWLDHPGTVGLPLPQWQVFAVDEAGQVLAPGQEGMLYARHQSLVQPFSYWNDAAKTARAYRAPGEVTLGDYGRVDPSGYVYIAARRSDLIIRGGVNIYPAEVEAVLLLHPAVQDACVFGRDDPEWGSCVHALVEIPGEVAGEDATIEQLRQLLEQNLAGFKHPQSLVITASIPRNAAGKVPQSALE